jgi:RNA polymerase sigma-70 factor (ECF subfamily)
MHEQLESLYRQDSRRVFSTLCACWAALTAEEALHDAFVAAAEQWPTQGVPANPVAWLVSAGRFKAIDRMRRNRRFVAWDEAAEQAEAVPDALAMDDDASVDAEPVEDDRLRLIFTCCHPALNADAQIALTLREVCGLTTEAIANACLVGTPTLAQRIVRAKSKIAAARIPYEVPGPVERPARLASVLRVVYLVFNEGHRAQAVTLADEAIRLARLLRELLPEPEVLGLWPCCCCTTRAAQHDCPPRGTWCRWKRRTARCGTARPSPKAARWRCRPCRSAALASMRCRLRLQRCMAKRPAQRPPIGHRSWACTTHCCAWNPAP